MMQEPIAGRRIVSKGEYVKAQSARFGKGFSGWCVLVLSIVIGFATFICALFVISGLLSVYQCHFEALPSVVMTLASFFVLGGVAWLLWRLGVDITNKASENNVVLLTRANAADIPAPESLVRASQEPVQAQESILLRAASGEAQAGQGGQLLRASLDYGTYLRCGDKLKKSINQSTQTKEPI